MENIELNEISTADFESIFSGGNTFADEAPIEAPVDDVSDLNRDVYNEESGSFEGLDYDNITTSPFDDLLSLNDDGEVIHEAVEGSELPMNVILDGVSYEREAVEKAVRDHSLISNFQNEINVHVNELDAMEENINKMLFIATAEINEYVDYYQNILDNPRSDSNTRMEAYNELKRYETQKQQLESQYQVSAKQLAERKDNAERLKGRAVYSDLTSKGWKENDFRQVADFMTQNDILIPAGQVNSSLMVALRKAALYDSRQGEAKEAVETSVQRAIAGKPARNSKPVISPENQRMKARASQLANAGELSTQDMFKFLVD